MSTGLTSQHPAFPGSRPGLADPPMPVGDNFEAGRVQEQRRRRRLIDGTWRADLEDRLRKTLGTQRADAIGPVSLALNPARNIWRELAVLYTKPPRVSHPSVGDLAPLTERLRLSGLWGLMPRVQTYTIGLREYLVRADIDSRGRLRFRPVAPDMVVARARPGAPDVPTYIEELRPRVHPTSGKPVWTRDVLSIEDPNNPRYEVREVLDNGEHGADWTAAFLGGPQSGGDYPYRPTGGGEPRIPYVLHHAQRTGDRLWDPWEGIELVEASLDLAVLHCFLMHVYRQASWPQRWIANLEVAGASVSRTDDGRRAVVVTDPATVLQLETPEGDGESRGQPMVGQFQPGADVTALEEVLSNLVARVAQDAGVPPSDVQRLGGTARSGVAISLTNEGKRAAQRRFQTHFRDTDERLMGICAVLLNRFGNLRQRLPEAGYQVAYQEIPLSPEELKARREHALELLREGLMSRVQAYQEMNPGVSREQAEADLATFERVQNSISPPPAAA